MPTARAPTPVFAPRETSSAHPGRPAPSAAARNKRDKRLFGVLIFFHPLPESSWMPVVPGALRFVRVRMSERKGREAPGPECPAPGIIGGGSAARPYMDHVLPHAPLARGAVMAAAVEVLRAMAPILHIAAMSAVMAPAMACAI